MDLEENKTVGRYNGFANAIKLLLSERRSAWMFAAEASQASYPCCQAYVYPSGKRKAMVDMRLAAQARHRNGQGSDIRHRANRAAAPPRTGFSVAAGFALSRGALDGYRITDRRR